MAALTFNGTVYVWEQCGTCGVWYTVPEIVYEHQRKMGGFHTCPSGHSWGWKQGQGEDAFDALRRERDQAVQEKARLEDEARAAWETANEQVAQRSKIERELKRVRQRITHGVCPCCNRSFANVQRHMKSKHPNVTPIAKVN